MALKKEEGATVTLRIEGVRRRDVHVPSFAGLRKFVGGGGDGGSVAFMEYPGSGSGGTVEDGCATVVVVGVDSVVRNSADEAWEEGKVGRVPDVEGVAYSVGRAPEGAAAFAESAYSLSGIGMAGWKDGCRRAEEGVKEWER